jgi:hypothetical protein
MNKTEDKFCPECGHHLYHFDETKEVLAYDWCVECSIPVDDPATVDQVQAMRDSQADAQRERFSSTEIKKVVWLKTNGACWYCGKQTHPFGKDRDSFQVDHFEPVSRGGTNAIENLVPCCGYCNNVKHNKTLDEIRKYIVGEQSRFYFEKDERMMT